MLLDEGSDEGEAFHQSGLNSSDGFPIGRVEIRTECQADLEKR